MWFVDETKRMAFQNSKSEIRGENKMHKNEEEIHHSVIGTLSLALVYLKLLFCAAFIFFFSFLCLSLFFSRGVRRKHNNERWKLREATQHKNIKIERKECGIISAIALWWNFIHKNRKFQQKRNFPKNGNNFAIF